MNKIFALIFLLIGSMAFGQYYPNTASPNYKAPTLSVGTLPSSGNVVGDLRLETTGFGLYVWNGTSWLLEATAAGGVVTSVGLSLTGPLFTVSGSPVTGAGTLTGTINTQANNTVFAGPTSGGPLAPTFRLLTAADIPALSYQPVLSTSSAPAHQFGTGFTAPNTFTYAQPAFSDISGTATTAQGGTNHGDYTAGSVPFAGAGGTTLTEDNTNFFYDSTNKNLKINNGQVQTDYVDPFARNAIWAYQTDQTIELGSWQSDGMPFNINSEGIIVYADEQLTSTPISASHGSYARIKGGRFGLFSVESTLPYYAGGAYWFRTDPTQMYYKDNSGNTTFSVQRTNGNTVIGGTAQVKSLGAGYVKSDASGNLSSSAIAAADIPLSVNKVYVDFISGSDSGTGSSQSPWKTLQHACSTISPTINQPYTIEISGGNNDSDAGPITCPANINIVSDYSIQLNQSLTISGGVTNDTVSATNILFQTLTWIRNDATQIQLTLNNCASSGLIDFEQQGVGSSNSSLFINGGGLSGGATVQAEQSTILARAIYGTLTFKDSGNSAFATITGADLYTTAIDVSGGFFLELSGNISDIGYSIVGHTTGSGTPTILSDSGSLPAIGSITGAYSLSLTSLSPYVSYSPTTPGNWSPSPTTVSAALDQLAARTPPSGFVSSISIANANGFAGSSSGGTTPTLTISTSVTGLLKGNGTAIGAASSGTDYQAPISTSSAPANQFCTGFTAPNTFTYAQPSFTNISGSPSTLQLAESVSSKSSNYTVLLTDRNMLGDASGGSFTFTLPSAASANSGGKSYVFYFKKIDSSANTVSISSSDLIDGLATQVLSTQYNSITVISDGSTYYVK